MNHERAGSVQQREGLRVADELSKPPPEQRDQKPQGMPPHEPTALASSPAAQQPSSLKPLKAGAPPLASAGHGMAAAGSDAQTAGARQAASTPAATAASAPQPVATGCAPAAAAALTQAGAAGTAQLQQQQPPGGVSTPSAAPQAATSAPSPPTAQRQAGAAGPAAAATVTGAGTEAEAAALMPPPPPSPAQQAVADLDALIQRLAALDPDGWFRHPVRESDAPHYYKIIRRPMCFEVGAWGRRVEAAARSRAPRWLLAFRFR